MGKILEKILCMLEQIVFASGICVKAGNIAIYVTFKGPKETGDIYKFYNSYILISDSDYFTFVSLNIYQLLQLISFCKSAVGPRLTGGFACDMKARFSKTNAKF